MFLSRKVAFFCLGVLSFNLASQEIGASKNQVTNSNMIDGNTSANLVNGCVNINMEADFIFWNRTTGPVYVADGIGIVLSPTDGALSFMDVAQRGSGYGTSFAYMPGVKAILGFDFNRDGWDLETSFTWIHFHDTASFSLDPAKGWQQPYTFWQDVKGAVNTPNAKNSYHMTVNLVEIALGRKFYTSSWLLLRPHMGVAVSYIPQSCSTTYNYTVPGTVSVGFQNLQYNSHGHGIGCGGSIGLDTEWRLSKNWSFIGNLSFASLYTSYKDQSKATVTNLNSGIKNQSLLSGLSIAQMQFLSSIFLGVDWHLYFNKDKYYVGIHAGWDFMDGFENWISSALGNRLQDAYGMQGLRTGFQFNF